MAKKPHDFRELSTVECCVYGCKKRIKKNVVARKVSTTGLKCRYHYWVSHGHRANRAGKPPVQPV